MATLVCVLAALAAAPARRRRQRLSCRDPVIGTTPLPGLGTRRGRTRQRPVRSDDATSTASVLDLTASWAQTRNSVGVGRHREMLTTAGHQLPRLHARPRCWARRRAAVGVPGRRADQRSLRRRRQAGTSTRSRVISTVQLIPGSNPGLGLNTLAALSRLHAKRRAVPGRRHRALTGSFGRRLRRSRIQAARTIASTTRRNFSEEAWVGAQSGPASRQFFGKLGLSGRRDRSLDSPYASPTTRCRARRRFRNRGWTRATQAHCFPTPTRTGSLFRHRAGTRSSSAIPILLGGNTYYRRITATTTSAATLNNDYGSIDPVTQASPQTNEATAQRSDRLIDQTSWGLEAREETFWRRSSLGRRNQFNRQRQRQPATPGLPSLVAGGHLRGGSPRFIATGPPLPVTDVRA